MLKHGRGTPFQTSYCQCGPILEAASWAAVPERSKLENINSNSHPNQCLPPHVDWINKCWKAMILKIGENIPFKYEAWSDICCTTFVGCLDRWCGMWGRKGGEGDSKAYCFCVNRARALLFYYQLKKCTLTVLQKFGQVRWKWYRAKADDDYYLFLCEILSLMKWVFICSYLYFGLYFLYLCPWHWMGQTG